MEGNQPSGELEGQSNESRGRMMRTEPGASLYDSFRYRGLPHRAKWLANQTHEVEVVNVPEPSTLDSNGGDVVE